MPHSAQIRPLADVPDHGFGFLGALAHSALADYSTAVYPRTTLPVPALPPVPHLHLGQNTLPDPPFPMAALVPFGGLSDLRAGWRECGEDLAAFLAGAARQLRKLPVPMASAFSVQARILQRVLRFDSIAMVWPSELTPAARPADAGLPTVIAVAVDRAGNALCGWMPRAGSAADIELNDEELTADDPIVALLRDVLLAQYEWTCKVFGR
jgi:hypothetical protein